MKRFLPICLCLILGCSAAAGGAPEWRVFSGGRQTAAIERPPAPKKTTTTILRDPAPAAPELEISDTAGGPGEFIEVVAKTNCKSVEFVALDRGLSLIPRKYLNTATATIVMGVTPGQYRILAYSSLNDVLTDPVIATITITGQAPQPPPGPAPNPNPQPQPPPAPTPVVETAQFLGIVIIDDITRRQPATAAILANPIWNALRAAGHKVINYNITDPAAKSYTAQLTANGGQPVLVITSLANNHWLNKDPADLKMQATAAGVQALVNKYTGK